LLSYSKKTMCLVRNKRTFSFIWISNKWLFRSAFSFIWMTN
jgi:hypothetical protein